MQVIDIGQNIRSYFTEADSRIDEFIMLRSEVSELLLQTDKLQLQGLLLILQHLHSVNELLAT